MADHHLDTPDESPVTIHTVPLSGEGKVLVFVAANAHVTHVISLSAQAARHLVVGLLEAVDLAAPAEDDRAWWDQASRP
jgi:hypothetical protein